MRRRIYARCLFVLLALSGLPAQTCLGCQYNVRETGFVDLGVERYFLFCYVSRQTPRDVVSALEKTARETLRDSRVVFQIVPVGVQEDHPALKYLHRSDASSLPSVVLVSPAELSLVIPVPGPANALEPAFETSLRNVVSSPFRETIVRHVASSYGVVLLIEGVKLEANAKAREAAEAAIETINSQIRYMPKPITRGPVLLTLTPDSFSSERVLLWSLGMDEEALGQPQAVVLYGRARHIGPLLKGDEITKETLYNILSIVGADCECGLDPRLIRGNGLPVRWDKDTQRIVAADLGFDPDNPMVITEVSQIMRMRASLYPWAFSAREDMAVTVDDLPVPFVEDMDPPRSSGLQDDPVLARLAYTVAGMAALVLIAGAFMVLRAARRTS